MSSLPDTPPARAARKRRSNALLIVALVLLVTSAAVAGIYFASAPTTLRIAVGPEGSDDQLLLQAMARKFADESSRVRLSVITTGGSPDSIALLNDNKADLAVARGDLDLPKDAQSLAILRKNVVVLWTPPDGARKKTRGARVKTIADLAGQRVGVLGRTSANVTLLRVILAESGVAPDKVQTTSFGLDQIPEMARDDGLSAYMAFGPVDSKTTIQAIAATAGRNGEIRFLPIDVSDAIAQRHPLYESDKIPKSSFSAAPSRPDDEIETVSVNHVVIAHRNLHDAIASDVLRQMLAARQALAHEVPQAKRIEKPDTDKDAALPVHPGAGAFIDGTERTFLEKYSDYLWASLFVLSGLGSLVAWLGHYAKHNERDLNASHRTRMLDKIGQLSGVQSLDQVHALRQEADDLLHETLQCYDDGAIDAGDLAAFSLILGQFNAALTERRLELREAAATQLNPT